MPRNIDKRIQRARNFRHNPTDAERKLWQRLRHIPLAHFRRQATIGPYFADFACHTTRIVIEVDGGQHAESESDIRRSAFFVAQGYRVLRFWNHDVLTNIEGVMEIVSVAVTNTPPTPDPSPPQERGEGSGSVAFSLSPTRSLRGGDATSRDARAEGSGVGGRLNKSETTGGNA